MPGHPQRIAGACHTTSPVAQEAPVRPDRITAAACRKGLRLPGDIIPVHAAR